MDPKQRENWNQKIKEANTINSLPTAVPKTRQEQKEIWDRMVREANGKKSQPLPQSKVVYNTSVTVKSSEFVIKPSQWSNFGYFLFAIIGCILVFPIIIWIANVLIVSCWSYRFSEKTITEKKGVFSVDTVQIQYFRIKSIKVLQPFWLRLVGLSTVEIITSEPFRPYLRLYAIRNGNEMKQFLSQKAELWREKMGVKETDFHSF